MTTDLDELLDRAYPANEVGPGDPATALRTGRRRHQLVTAATTLGAATAVGILVFAVARISPPTPTPVIEGVGTPLTESSTPSGEDAVDAGRESPERDAAQTATAEAISEASERQRAAVVDEQVTFAEYETAVLSFADCMARLDRPVSNLRLDDRLERYEWRIAADTGGDAPCYGRTLADVERLWTIAIEQRREARGWGDVDRFRACLASLGQDLPADANAGAGAVALSEAGMSPHDCRVVPPVEGIGTERALVELQARGIKSATFTVSVADPDDVGRVVAQAPGPGTVVDPDLPVMISLQIGVMPEVGPSLLLEGPGLTDGDVATWMNTIAACMTDAGVPTTFSEGITVTAAGDAPIEVFQDCAAEHPRPDASTQTITTRGWAWIYDRWLGPVSDCLADLGVEPTPAPPLSHFLIQPDPSVFWNPALSASSRDADLDLVLAIQEECAQQPPFDLLVRINDGEVTSPSTEDIAPSG